MANTASGRRTLVYPTKKYLKEISEHLLGIVNAAKSISDQINILYLQNTAPFNKCLKKRPRQDVPQDFRKSLTKEVGGKKYWKGNPLTYQAQPTERVQRLSTLASASNTMQMACYALRLSDSPQARRKVRDAMEEGEGSALIPLINLLGDGVPAGETVVDHRRLRRQQQQPDATVEGGATGTG